MFVDDNMDGQCNLCFAARYRAAATQLLHHHRDQRNHAKRGESGQHLRRHQRTDIQREFAVGSPLVGDTGLIDRLLLRIRQT